MEQITLTREELLELARETTFHLDDRLAPYSREDLRAMAWIEGFLFAKRHQQQAEQDKEPAAMPNPHCYPDIIRNVIREYLGYWLECTESFAPFVKGEHYWLELMENGQFFGRSDNVKGKIIIISIACLLNNFKPTEEKL